MISHQSILFNSKAALIKIRGCVISGIGSSSLGSVDILISINNRINQKYVIERTNRYKRAWCSGSSRIFLLVGVCISVFKSCRHRYIVAFEVLSWIAGIDGVMRNRVTNSILPTSRMRLSISFPLIINATSTI